MTTTTLTDLPGGPSFQPGTGTSWPTKGSLLLSDHVRCLGAKAAPEERAGEQAQGSGVGDVPEPREDEELAQHGRDVGPAGVRDGLDALEREARRMPPPASITDAEEGELERQEGPPVRMVATTAVPLNPAARAAVANAQCLVARVTRV